MHAHSRKLAVLALMLPSLAPACSDPSTTNGASSDGGATLDGASPVGDGGVLADGAAPPPPPVDGGPTPGPTGCAPLAIAAGPKVDGTAADTFTWFDSSCRARVASLFRNDATDAFGEHGGYLRSIAYDANGKTRQIRGTGSNGWQGFGYIINHFGNGASENQGFGGTYKTLLAGRHHALHEFKLRINPGGAVDVTVQWFFATGRSHPLFLITFDATPAGPNVVNADTRAPYGDLAWDDGKAGDVDGVGWGDKYQFKTTGAGPVTPRSAWDYAKPNVVPYAFEWSTSTDSEMGLVATQTWATRIQGGDYGSGTISGAWGKSGTSLLTDVVDWSWPYQLNQYELPFVTTSHRVAWGANYGAVGQASYQAFGKTLSGYPFQSYSVFVVLGTHAQSAVGAAALEIEAVQGVKLTATRGTVATQGQAGIGRTDTIAFTPAGFDPVFAAWAVDASSNAATVSFDTGSARIANPVIELRGYTASTPPAQVTLAGRALVADTDYFATVDVAGRRLWLTLNASLAGRAELSVQ